MPTVLRRNGFSVRMYFNDHGPPHVHVVRDRGEAQIALAPVTLLSVQGMKLAEASKARQVVAENRDFLLRKWVELHGLSIL